MVFASGSPYKPIEYEGKTFEPGQGNNMYIFPGIGLGTILSKARHVTDAMVEQASIALSSSLSRDEETSELVYPRLTRIRDISAQIALAVIRSAQLDVCPICELCHAAAELTACYLQDLDENPLFRQLSDEALLEYIKAKMWQPTTSHTFTRL